MPLPNPKKPDPAGLDAVVHCPHGAECPGCPLLPLTYGAQLDAKRARVASATTEYPELARAAILDVVPGDPITEYRSRAKLVANGTQLGLFARGTHRVVDIPQCRVLDPVLSRVATRVRAQMPHEVTVRAVDLQRAGQGVFVTLVVPDRTEEARVRDAASALARDVPEVVGVAVSYRDERSHQVLGRAPVSLVGSARERVHALGEGAPYHFVAPGSFTQAHRAQQRRMLEAVLATISAETAGRRDIAVLDLYSGAGALALALSARGARVVAVESYEPAAALARAAAEEQNLSLQVESADAAEVVHEVLMAGERPDVVIVNPPRRGLSAAARAGIGRLSPALLVYISCEPATLGRDLADFAHHGLSPRSVTPFDMMPLTEEVEALAVAVRGEAPLPKVLYEDERLIAVAKSPHEPTIPQGEHASSLLMRVRRLEGASEAVPVHRLDIGTSGVCLMARAPAHVAVIARALAEGEKEYAALCKGVVRDKGSVRRPLVEHGRPQAARTRYSRRDVVGGHSLLAVRPDEGRKHQIRRHLASIGHPVVGDERYGDPRTNSFFSMRYFLDRPFLHCARISMDLEGRKLELKAPITADLNAVLVSLGSRDADGEDDE